MPSLTTTAVSQFLLDAEVKNTFTFWRFKKEKDKRPFAIEILDNTAMIANAVLVVEEVVIIA